MHDKLIRLLLAGAVAVIVVAHAFNGAAAPAAPEPVAAENTIIALRLSVAGRTAAVKIPNRGCASVTPEGEETIHVFAQLVGVGFDLAGWQSAADVESCSPPANAVRAKLSGKGTAEFIFENSRLQIEVLAVSTASAAASGSQGPCTTCCVICQGDKFCACEVETPCGRCCCPDTCGCQPAPIAQGIR